MILDISTPFPSLQPNTLYSFSSYPPSPRRHLNHILLHPPNDQPQPQPQAGPSTPSLHGVSYCKEKDEVNKLMRRAERRVLMGKSPAGMMLGREDEEVAMEEDLLEHEQKMNINMFGHRFLLPFGRRQTQMEMDSAPSPSPSEPDHEHRQEDNSMAMPMNTLPDEDGNEARGQDLDASIEDMDDTDEYDDLGDDGNSVEARDLDGDMEDMDEE
ncbi:hypothetical protein C347_04425 [Cryptococcus neoformans AD2-60a]|uniref:Uncharacterized protein n=1 Tax=Cryptococcus neoformans (strain H99 / ATCC 208821 / CBS 10515 / FGSC 9487) TaxID=235443 RepID=J9VP37_CRYN9|nr:hypothetical protein CNAG_05928 [Cryptococcus neoformans var. grubii H99]AFR96247.2 hypothetical protein CNAG_05928 [Cryptococcus neoformans var. grubii H99]AUB26142.1 hypothetical protein CKF44_05928 [Cryptococcus neoformans var. grubii]OWZ30663.1 hypothetical protein C347_04425 [Cryptococcus neoformans var. grubii AD2-60a]|eukprot:XP_012050421.1 hypothetical protein CNAG_05928 [Cryptococcus neoformans var. grubii H99]